MLEKNLDGSLERELSADGCFNPYVCLGTVSKTIVKDSEWALPRVHLDGSSENVGLGINLGHSFDWKWGQK